MAKTEPIRDKSQVEKLLSYYRKLGQYRNHLLINIGIYTVLRISEAYVKQKLNENSFCNQTVTWMKQIYLQAV